MRPLTEEEKSFLLHYTWPGNIRELKNIMERYVILNDMENRLSINNFISTAPLEKTSSNPSPDFFQALPSLKQLETEYLEYVFRKTHGKVDGEDGMGTILGLSRQQVYLRIKQAGIRDKFKKGYFKENPR